MNRAGAALSPSYDRASVPTVLFLGASVSQLDAIRQARASGWRVVAVDADPRAIGFPEADVAEAVDFTDLDRVVEVAGRHRIDAVVAISADRAVPVAAAVATKLGLPGIGIETARVMTDKAAMRARLQEHALPQPAFAVLGDEFDPTWELDAVGCPAVLKPADSGGQRGVYRIDDRASLAKRLPLTLAFSRSGRAILERYIEGRELNGIVVARDGDPLLLTLSDRLRPPGDGFGVGWIHLYPSDLEPALLETAGEVAVAAVRALGLRDGIAFPQLLVTHTGDVFVVEVAARIPAGQMADLVRLGTGVDLVEVALTQALGGPVTDAMVEARFHRPLAVSFLTAGPGILPTGTVVAIDGLDRVRSAPGVLQADLYMQIGETIHPVHVDADRRGYVIATAADPHEALELARQASRHLRVEVAR
jgi:biotin carboxylase